MHKCRKLVWRMKTGFCLCCCYEFTGLHRFPTDDVLPEWRGQNVGRLPQSQSASQVCNDNDFPDMWMDAQMHWLQPGLLASSYSSWVLQLSAERQREGDMKRQASKGAHLTTLFADRSMHTSRQIMLQWISVERWGLSMERFKVNKHHSPLAETASGYVHLGCVPAALLCVHGYLPLLTCLRKFTLETLICTYKHLLFSCWYSVHSNDKWCSADLSMNTGHVMLETQEARTTLRHWLPRHSYSHIVRTR